MADFTIENLIIQGYPRWVEIPQPLWDWEDRNKEDFGWWCLGHNFDVVACILAMAHLSWEKGFDAGRAIKSLTDAHEDIENNRHALYPDIFNR